MSNRNPLITQRGIISAGPISFNNKNPDNREITNVSMIGISDSSSSSDTMSLSKQGQTGYFELAGNSQSFVFSPTNTFGTGSNVLSISDNVATIRNTLILQDGSNKTIFTQTGANMIISGGITFESNTSVDNILVSNITATNVVADSIGVTGIVASTIRTNYIGATGLCARNITGTNISADSIGATGIVASTIRSNYIGATGLVAINITGTNITATYINATQNYYGDGSKLTNITSDKLTTMSMTSGTFYLPWIKSPDGSSNLISYSTGKINYDFNNDRLSVPNLTGQSIYANTITGSATDFTIQNVVGSGNINLNTTSGNIITNSIIVPSDNIPAVISTRPSIGYSYFKSETPVLILSTVPINVWTTTIIPIGTWMFEGSVTVFKSSNIFPNDGTLATTRFSYENAVGLTFVGTSNAHEKAYASNLITGVLPCGVIGPTRVVTIITAQKIPMTFQANWGTIIGTPTFTVNWSVIRIA